VRRTRIVATIGPSLDSDEVLKALARGRLSTSFDSPSPTAIFPPASRRLRRLRGPSVPDRAIMVDHPRAQDPGRLLRYDARRTHGRRRDRVSEGFDAASTASHIVVERFARPGAASAGRHDPHRGRRSLFAGRTDRKEGPGPRHVRWGGHGKPGLSLPSSLLNDRLPTDDDRARLDALRTESFEILAGLLRAIGLRRGLVRSALGAMTS